MNPLVLPADYAQWLASLKQRIQGARQRALLAAIGEQIRLYHDIGREIMDRQSRQGWGGARSSITFRPICVPRSRKISCTFEKVPQ